MTYYFVVFWDKRKNEINHFGQLGFENILWNSTPTLFKTYDKARNAIRRTQTYAKKNEMPWFSYWYARIMPAVLPK